MKKIKSDHPWHPEGYWLWPEGDEKLVQVLDWVSDIAYMVGFVEKTRVCVQAGGATGVWPYRFSQIFKKVYTFEPQRENFECLIANIASRDNIDAINAPLSYKGDDNLYSITNDITERRNWGAGYVVPDKNGLKPRCIDSLNLDACDLIQLDIEGYELNALKGAAETIEKFGPVIVLEEKPLNHMKADYKAPRKWLKESFGYRLAGNIHKDVILSL